MRNLLAKAILGLGLIVSLVAGPGCHETYTGRPEGKPAAPSLSAVSFFITITPSPAVAGNTLTVRIEAIDVDGNTVTDYEGTVKLAVDGIASSGHTFPENVTFTQADLGVVTILAVVNEAGTAVVTLTDENDNTVSGTTSIEVQETPETATKFDISLNPDPLTENTIGQLCVTPVDDNNNEVTSYSGSVNVSIDISASFTNPIQINAGDTLPVCVDVMFLENGRAEITATDSDDSSITITETFTIAGDPDYDDSGQSLGTFNTFGVAVSDVDGDGDLDVLTGNRGEDNKIWLNDASGNFSDSGQALGASGQTVAVAMGDLDGDGDDDAVFSAFDGGESISVWENNAGTFTQNAFSMGDDWATPALDLGDVNGDGDLDLVIGNFSNIGSAGLANQVWFGNGDGTFTDSGQSLGSRPTSHIQIADLDKDGDLDFVASSYSAADVPTEIYLNNGSGVFSLSQSLVAGTTWRTGVGDVNGDGYVDLATTDFRTYVKIWLNGGASNPGVFTDSGQALGDGGSETAANRPNQDASFADLDGDGDLDVIIAQGNWASGDTYPDKVYLNDGKGIFTDLGVELGDDASTIIRIFDFNNDGFLDQWIGARGANKVRLGQ